MTPRKPATVIMSHESHLLHIFSSVTTWAQLKPLRGKAALLVVKICFQNQYQAPVMSHQICVMLKGRILDPMTHTMQKEKWWIVNELHLYSITKVHKIDLHWLHSPIHTPMVKSACSHLFKQGGWKIISKSSAENWPNASFVTSPGGWAMELQLLII